MKVFISKQGYDFLKRCTFVISFYLGLCKGLARTSKHRYKLIHRDQGVSLKSQVSLKIGIKLSYLNSTCLI